MSSTLPQAVHERYPMRLTPDPADSDTARPNPPTCSSQQTPDAASTHPEPSKRACACRSKLIPLGCLERSGAPVAGTLQISWRPPSRSAEPGPDIVFVADDPPARQPEDTDSAITNLVIQCFVTLS
jgi:hypothetical protein